MGGVVHEPIFNHNLADDLGKVMLLTQVSTLANFDRLHVTAGVLLAMQDSGLDRGNVLDKVRKGREDGEHGRVISHEDVKREIAQ